MDDWKYQPAADLGLTARERYRSLKRESGLLGTFSQSMWRLAVRSYLHGYHHLRIIGRDHLPAQAPFIMVANHTSHLDALILSAALPWKLRRSAFPIAAGDVFFETPAAAFFSAMMLNALPMWRRSCGPHAMQQLRERLLGEPAIYILFPEGTRSRDGSMGRFRPGIGMLIASSPAPVVPCRLQGAFAACPPTGKIPRPLPIEVRIGPPLGFATTENNRPGWEDIAEKLEAAVRSLE